MALQIFGGGSSGGGGTAAAGDADAWSVVSSRPVKLGDAITVAATVGQSTRLREVAPYAMKAVRLVYSNWQLLSSVGEYPNFTGIRVAAAVHKGGTNAPDRDPADPYYPVTFAGREFGYCAPGKLLLSDPVPIGLVAGETWFHTSYADTILGAGPAAPTLTLSAGTTLAIGSHFVALTYVYADGSESLPGPETQITTTSGQQNIIVTAPAAAPGVIGYRVYVAVTGTAGAIKADIPSLPMQPLGTNATLPTIPVSSALLRSTRTAANAGVPLGRGLLADIGGATLGESSIGGRDYTAAPVTMGGAGGSYGGVFSPMGVLGVASDGRVHRSAAIIGDSLAAGTGDNGYGGALGGYIFRACANQTAQFAYDKTKTPRLGFLMLAQGGETLSSFATAAGGSRRRAASELATTIVDEYGINDAGSGSAVIANNMMATVAYYAGRKRYFRTTLPPNNRTSTDAFQTVANQTIASTDMEADRRALNNLIRGTSGAVTITGEAMFRSPGTATPTDDLYSGGNGAAVKFFTAYPFRTGTQTVKVNGATKALTTDYTYLRTQTIGGVQYASGVTFVAAPGNGLTVTMDYTKLPSFGTLTGYTGFFDAAAPVEVNAAGTPTPNGGWWLASVATGGDTGTATASTSTLLTDSSKAWTVDGYRGWTAIITADATTPAAVGQANGIKSNTATALSFQNGWTTTPSATASYKIVKTPTVDGTHPTSWVHMLMSQQVDATAL